MKIPEQQFGYKAPTVASPPAVGPGSFVVQGVPELGTAGLRIGHEMAQSEAQDLQLAAGEQHRKMVEAESEAHLVAREAKRAEAMTVHAKAQNALAAEHDRIRGGIQDGTIGTDAAPKMWAEASSKIVDDHLQAVDRSNVELVRAGLAGNVGEFGRSVNGAVVTQNRHKIGAGLSDYLEQMQRFGLSDPATAKKQGVMAIDAQGPLAGYNPEQVGKMRQGFVETIMFNDASQRLNGSQNSRAALDQFVTDLPGMADLDPGKKNILESKAQTLITRLDTKAAAAESRRLTQLQVVGGRLETRIAMGVPIRDAELASYQATAKGTPFEEFANGLADEQRTVAELLRKTPAEQAAYVSELEQRLVTTGQGDPRIVGRLQKTVAATIKMVNDNPPQYAVDRGGAVIEPLDLQQPDSWNDNLAHRTQVIRAQYQQVGGGLGVLYPQEAATLGRILDTGTPETQKKYLEPIRRAIGDDQVYRATIQQVAKDAPTVALAATIATKEAPLVAGSMWWKTSFENGDTASLILEGRKLLNPSRGDKAQDGKGKGFPMPAGADAKMMRTRFADTVGEVFAGAPQAYDVALQGAEEAYAGMLARKGNFSGELDTRAWAEAIKRTSSIGRYNGSAIALPWGMDEAAFKDRVANAFPQALKNAGLPAEMAGATGRFTLQNVSGTSYLVRQGTEYLTGPRGKVMISVPETASTFLTPSQRAARQVPE